MAHSFGNVCRWLLTVLVGWAVLGAPGVTLCSVAAFEDKAGASDEAEVVDQLVQCVGGARRVRVRPHRSACEGRGRLQSPPTMLDPSLAAQRPVLTTSANSKFIPLRC